MNREECYKLGANNNKQTEVFTRTQRDFLACTHATHTHTERDRDSLSFSFSFSLDFRTTNSYVKHTLHTYTHSDKETERERECVRVCERE